MKKPLECEDREKYFSLCSKIGVGRTAEARAIVESGIDLDCHVDNQITLMQRYINEDRAKEIYELIELGADVDGTEGNILNVTRAVAANNIRSLRVLLVSGAKTHGEKSKEDQAPLIRACEYGYTDIVRELVKYKVRMNAGAEKYALALTCRYGYQSICRVLLDAGAKTEFDKAPHRNHLVDEHLRQPIVEAIENDNVGCLDLLLQAGAEVTQYAHDTCASNARLDCLKLLVEQGMQTDIETAIKAVGSLNALSDHRNRAIMAFVRYLLTETGLEPGPDDCRRLFWKAVYRRGYAIFDVYRDCGLKLQSQYRDEVLEAIRETEDRNAVAQRVDEFVVN